MESWRSVWRNGLAPLLSEGALAALKEALEGDDPRLLQGGTTSPPPLQCVQDWPVEAACPLGFAGWQGEGLDSVAEVEQYFARLCYECDLRLDGPAEVRHFIRFVDETPRGEMRAALLPEVVLALGGRARD